MKKKYVYIISLSFLLIIGTFAIILFSTRIINKRIARNNYQSLNNNEIIIQSNAKEEKISPGALMIFKIYYKKCGHTITQQENVKKDLVNLNEEEFKKIYRDWNIQEFSNKKIVLSKEIDDECNEHFLVKSNDGLINIYKIESDGNISIIEKTEIEIKYLSDNDQKDLEEGVTLVGKQQLNGYIENFE